MKICEFCKKEFVPDGEYRGRIRRFCSRECYLISLDSSITIRCVNCEKQFVVKGKYKNRKFCSSNCVYQYKNRTGETRMIPCTYCGKVVRRYKYQYNKTMQIFCSQNCISRYKQDISIDCDDYFEEINTPQKAYILGLIASDGSVSDDNKINLCMNDLDAIQFVIGEIGYRNKITTVEPKSKRHNTSYSITIRNDKIGGDLKKLNILPRKSFIEDLYPPSIDADMEKYFWSGFMDGDGSVSITKSGYIRLSAVSKSKKYIDKFCEFLAKNDIKSSIYKSKNIWCISFGGKHNAKQIYQLIYSRDFGMERKKCKFKNYVASI